MMRRQAAWGVGRVRLCVNGNPYIDASQIDVAAVASMASDRDHRVEILRQ